YFVQIGFGCLTASIPFVVVCVFAFIVKTLSRFSCAASTLNLLSQLLKGRVTNYCLVSLFFKYIGMKKTANILKTTLAVFFIM
ncbi:hypothetical protein ACT7CN_09725, partial [Bacillus cereus]